MKQVVQTVANGQLRVLDVPRPVPGPTEVLVAVRRSVLSPGTERAVRRLASSSLLEKARARPDLVRQVVSKARAEGIATTYRSVRTRLDESMPLGYSACGLVVQVGEAVSGLRPGQRVATGSAGHAEYQLVPGHLAVPVPDTVSDVSAAFATVASIALHGLRQAELQPGSKVCVIGLGLVGQIAARLALASGCDVLGLDLRPWTCERLRQAGGRALVEGEAGVSEAVRTWTRGRGADAVLVTAATASSAPVQRATEIARDRARIVVVGDVGLDLQRTPFYEKELELRFARSYGPGRYDRSYEQWGVDYPVGHVRWTEGRNLEAVLDLLAGGRLQLEDLVTHTFPIERAADAYSLLDDGADVLGMQLVCGADASSTPQPPIVLSSRRTSTGLGLGLIGAGTYARATLMPALDAAGLTSRVVVASPGGLSARHLAERAGFQTATSDVDDVLAAEDVDLVLVASRHDSHADLVVRALEAGKHVLCEKPLALTEDELAAVTAAWTRSTSQLLVGFNRRHSGPVRAVRAHFSGVTTPLVLTYRVSAGQLDSKHWYADRRQGGRLLGEVCHFVDTCAAVAGPVVSVHACGSGPGEALLQQELLVSLQHAGGSLSTISYGTGGHSGTAKERLEVLGGGRSAVIDDYRRVLLDERQVPGSHDRGHVAELRTFMTMCTTGEGGEELTRTGLHSSAVILAAACSMLSGTSVDVS